MHAAHVQSKAIATEWCDPTMTPKVGTYESKWQLIYEDKGGSFAALIKWDC